MRKVVENKSKNITIRKGHRDYEQGDWIKVGCDSYGWYQVEVVKVTYTQLGFITKAQLAADGFKDWDDMFQTMRQFYPNIHASSPVTVIEWEYV
jgi:hypothetical protein